MNCITEILDKAGFEVIYSNESDTWSIVDTVDTDGYRKVGILPKDKIKEIEIAYKYVMEKIYRIPLKNN